MHHLRGGAEASSLVLGLGSRAKVSSATNVPCRAAKRTARNHCDFNARTHPSKARVCGERPLSACFGLWHNPQTSFRWTARHRLYMAPALVLLTPLGGSNSTA